MPRIVSLLPSATEIVCSLGLQNHLVGRSHECDYPAGLDSLPICTEPKINVQGTSKEIDQQVRELTQNALSVYEIKTGILKELKPTHIITQALCEVCAVSLQDVEKAVSETLDSDTQIISLEPSTLDDVWQDIERVAEALQIPDTGKQVADSLRARVKEVGDKTELLRRKPTVVCLEWLDPLMASGNWIPQMVRLAGGMSLLGEPGEHSPSIDWNTLHSKDPEIIALMPCGFDLERTKKEAQALHDIQDWKALRAVQTGKVYALDGHHYFNRPGPRLADSVEILAEIFQPAKFKFGHRGKSWDKIA